MVNTYINKWILYIYLAKPEFGGRAFFLIDRLVLHGTAAAASPARRRAARWRTEN